MNYTTVTLLYPIFNPDMEIFSLKEETRTFYIYGEALAFCFEKLSSCPDTIVSINTKKEFTFKFKNDPIIDDPYFDGTWQND